MTVFFDAGAATPSASGPNVDQMSKSSAAQFIELKKLRDQGVLTQEEYLRAVERIK